MTRGMSKQRRLELREGMFTCRKCKVKKPKELFYDQAVVEANYICRSCQMVMVNRYRRRMRASVEARVNSIVDEFIRDDGLYA